MGSRRGDINAVRMLSLCLLLPLLLSASAEQFNISSEGGCLKCGDSCLSAVQESLPGCLAPALAAAGAWAGIPVPDLGLTGGVVSCVKELFSASSSCKGCIESLVCCVTDSCNFCACDCHNLLQFTAPLSSPTRDEQPWLFAPQCHFVYIGTPDCQDCDGKRVYRSVDCENQVYLHYHDYIIDGRWVMTENIDSDDKTAVVRNKGDGWDDEECPEKETYNWELRSKKTDAGWIKDSQLKLEQFIKEQDLIRTAKLLAEKRGIVKL